MPRTKRAQVLMEPEEYARLEKIARGRGVSVAELIRTAVRETYLLSEERRRKAVDRICSMNLPVGDWKKVEEEIAQVHDQDLP